jgi:hypothetical protein
MDLRNCAEGGRDRGRLKLNDTLPKLQCVPRVVDAVEVEVEVEDGEEEAGLPLMGEGAAPAEAQSGKGYSKRVDEVEKGVPMICEGECKTI